jgi:hypothetical protein
MGDRQPRRKTHARPARKTGDGSGEVKINTLTMQKLIFIILILTGFYFVISVYGADTNQIVTNQVHSGVMSINDGQKHSVLNVKTISDLSSALLTPIIAIVTTIILINQYRLEKRKLRLQLFEKRYPVYLATMEYITTMMRDGKSTSEAQASFIRDSRDRVFLFDKDIHQFLDDLWKQSIDLETHQEILCDLPVGPDRTTHVKAVAAIKTQLPVFAKRAQELFGYSLTMVEK